MRKEDSMPPTEKMATDSDQYMITSGCSPASWGHSFSVLFSAKAVALSGHTPKERP